MITWKTLLGIFVSGFAALVIGFVMILSIPKPAIASVKQDYTYYGGELNIKAKVAPNSKVYLDKKFVGKADKEGKITLTLKDKSYDIAGKHIIKDVTDLGSKTKSFVVYDQTLYDDLMGYSSSDDSSSDEVPSDYDTDISYEDIYTEPEDNKYKMVNFSGTVNDVLEQDGVVIIQLAVDGDTDQMIEIDAKSETLGSSHFVDGDSITVYGGSMGTGDSSDLPVVVADGLFLN